MCEAMTKFRRQLTIILVLATAAVEVWTLVGLAEAGVI